MGAFPADALLLLEGLARSSKKEARGLARELAEGLTLLVEEEPLFGPSSEPPRERPRKTKMYTAAATAAKDATPRPTPSPIASANLELVEEGEADGGDIDVAAPVVPLKAGLAAIVAERAW